MLRLLKLAGFQRLVASIVGGGLTWLGVSVMSLVPPDYWQEWPHQASLSLSHLIAGSLSVAFCVWAYFTLKPIMVREHWIGRCSRVLFGLTLLSGIGGIWQCCLGLFFLVTGDEAALLPIANEWLRVVGWPVLIGAIPLCTLDFYEWIRINPHLRRWLWSGQGHSATWIRPHELKQLCKPFSRPCGRRGGILEEY